METDRYGPMKGRSHTGEPGSTMTAAMETGRYGPVKE